MFVSSDVHQLRSRNEQLSTNLHASDPLPRLRQFRRIQRRATDRASPVTISKRDSIHNSKAVVDGPASQTIPTSSALPKDIEVDIDSQDPPKSAPTPTILASSRYSDPDTEFPAPENSLSSLISSQLESIESAIHSFFNPASDDLTIVSDYVSSTSDPSTASTSSNPSWSPISSTILAVILLLALLVGIIEVRDRIRRCWARERNPRTGRGRSRSSVVDIVGRKLGLGSRPDARSSEFGAEGGTNRSVKGKGSRKFGRLGMDEEKGRRVD